MIKIKHIVSIKDPKIDGILWVCLIFELAINIIAVIHRVSIINIVDIESKAKSLSSIIYEYEFKYFIINIKVKSINIGGDIYHI